MKHLKTVEIYAERLAVLSAQERAMLRSTLESPLYQKFMRVVACARPSAACSKAGSGDRDAFADARANARLGEIRGWELHEAAIFMALNEPAEIRRAPEDTFPDSGRIDADWDKKPRNNKS